MEMKCPNCGRDVEAGAAFCGNCGQPLAGSADNPAAAGADAAASDQTDSSAVQTQAVPAATPPSEAVQNPTPPTVSVAAPVQPTASGPAPAGGQLPAAAIPSKSGEVKGIIGLITGVLAVPGAIIPIVGFVLGIVAIVLGSLSVHAKKALAVLAFVFGGIGFLLAIVVFIITLQNYDNLHHKKLSAVLQTVDTPCYSVKISNSLHVENSSGSCETLAYDGSTVPVSTVAYSVDSSLQSSLSSSNLDSQAQAAGPTFIKNLSESLGTTLSLDSQHGGTFDGESAYFYEVSSARNTKGEIVLVVHNAPNGDNTFILSEFSLGQPDVAALAQSWTWK